MKREKDWPAIDDKHFLFSLYTNDYVVTLKGKKERKGYFRGTDRRNGNISILPHEKTLKEGRIRGIGVQGLEEFSKYRIDILGYHKEAVIISCKGKDQEKREKRNVLAISSHTK